MDTNEKSDDSSTDSNQNIPERDELPRALVDTPHWLLWEAGKRKPFGWDEETNTPDYKASWTDPDDLLTFDKAHELATKYGSYGIGFVTLKESDRIALDLDGCVLPDGELASWLPKLDVFTGETYMEYSPSGTGIHTFCEHPGLPDWWSNSFIDDKDHEGIEAYEQKFFTVTGDRYEGSADEIGDPNPEGFLWKAYKNINGETPNIPERNTSSGRNSGGPSGRNGDISISVYEIPGISKSRFPEGERKAHPVHGSNTGANFHIDEGGETWVCWRGSCDSHDGHATVGNALHLLGMQESIIECGQWTPEGSGVSSDEWSQIFDAAREQGLDVPDKERQSRNGASASTSTLSENERDEERIAELYMGDDTDSSTSAQRENGKTTERGDGETWETVYVKYDKAAFAPSGEKSVRRKKARYKAVNLFLDTESWLTNEENDMLYHYDGGRFYENGKSHVKTTLQENIREYNTSHERQEIIGQLRSATTVKERELGGPAEHVCAQDGVLRLDNGETTTLDHNPEYNFLSQLGTEYDPNADCPTWKRCLSEWLTNDVSRMKLQEYAGYCLMHWDLPYHKALFLVGPTASGKSTWLKTMKALLGEGTTANYTPQKLTTQRFAPAGIYGKWANIRNEIPTDDLKGIEAFKEITAGDPIEAEWKFKDSFEFEPKAKHMYSGNQLPDVETDDEAFFRRILLVPFPATVPVEERDKDLPAKLRSELPGILNWALEGLHRLREQDGFTGDLPPGRTQETWEKWGHAADRFLSVCLSEAPDNAIPKSTVYRAFVRYCEDENIPSCSQRQLTTRLKEEGVLDGKEYVNGEQDRVYYVEFTQRGKQYLDSDGNDSQSTGLDEY